MRIHLNHSVHSENYLVLESERTQRSVANLTCQDAEDFLKLAPTIPIRTTVQTLHLEDANLASEALRNGQLTGATVLVP